MKRLIFWADQLPGWAFLLAAAAILGLLRGAWALSRLHANAGGTELFAILFGAGVIVLVIFAVRRRQSRAWAAALHVLAALAMANVLGVVVLWPFLPARLPVSLLDVVVAGVASGAMSAVIGAPLAIAGLWLSRRYGSHSAVTERRLGVVRARRLRVFGARGRAAAREPESR